MNLWRAWKNIYTESSKAMKVTMGVLFVVLYIPAIYFAYTYSGPYQWIAELQIKYFGGYSRELTLMLTALSLWIVLNLPVAMIVRVVEAMWISPSPNSTGAKKKDYYLLKSAGPYIVVLGLIALAAGVYDYKHPIFPDELEQANVADFEGHTRPSSTFLNLHGDPVWSAAIHWDDTSAERIYVPLVSPTWKTGQPVSVFLSLGKSEFDQWSKDSKIRLFRGIISPAPLIGPVRVRLEKTAYLPAENAILFIRSDSPSSTDKLAMPTIAIGALIAFIGLAYSIWNVWEHSRKSAQVAGGHA